MRIASLFLGLLLSLSVTAQVQTGITTGAGWSYVSGKNVAAKYGPSFLPRIDFFLTAPLGKAISFTTGLGYQRKGYTVHSVLLDDQMRPENIFNSVLHLDYLQVPIQLTYHREIKPRQQLQFSAGLYYGFLLQASLSGEHDYISDGGYMVSSAYSFPLQVGLTRTSRNATGKKTDELLIDCGMKFQLNYIFHEHFTAGIFHEHSLYDISAKNTGPTVLKMRYTGFSIGYIF